MLSYSVSGRHESNHGTTKHTSHRSDDTSTRAVISVSQTHTKETFWSVSHPSTQTPPLLGLQHQLQHMCWLCPFKVLLEMLQCVSVHVCMQMTYFLWCVFLQKCNTATTGVLWSMEIITMSVFAWQPKTSYYNRFIKSPLGTDILIWLFQAFDWGTGGRKAVALWWLSHFVCHFVKEREKKRASWIKVVLLQQTWAAQLAVRDISTWINGHNSNPKIYVTYYIIYNILVNIFIIEFNERKRLKLCMSPSAGHFTVLTFHISWSTVQILHIIVYIYHLCVRYTEKKWYRITLQSFSLRNCL